MAVEWESAAMRAATGRFTESQARAVINSILEHAGQEIVVFYKVQEWFAEWLADKEGAREATTTEKYGQVIKRFFDHLGHHAQKGWADIRPTDIRAFRDLLRAEGRSASTVNQTFAKVLSTPFAKAVRLGYIPVNLCAAVGPLKKIHTEAETFPLEQVKSILAASPNDQWRCFVLMAFHTGQRMRDLADLRWSQVDLAEGVLFWEQKKGGAGVAVPIHAE